MPNRIGQYSVQAAAATETPVILVSEKLGSAGLDLLNGFGTADCSYDLTPEQLCEKIQHVDALIVRSATKVTRAVFEASKGRLKVVGRAGVGIDNVDLQAATEYGCLVVNAPTANTVAAAEHGIALICALSRNVAQADASVKRGEWKRSQYTGVSLVGKTLAIMGFGKVGSEVARRARGLGMTIIAHDPFASEAKAAAIGVRLVALNEALVQGDFFSLHMPLTGQTKGMFNDDAFSKIKKGARIINVARGGVIDDHALARALDAGQVAQAALDVFNVEPPPADSPLVNRQDVVCTPHLGASTTEAQEGVAVEIADAVIGALKGELAATAVNAPMVPAEVLAELQPFVSLSQGLGTAAVQLVRDTGFTDIKITYCSPRGDDLDTRLLRAMVIKGILEQITTSTVNLVNADLLAKTRGLRIIESTVPSEGRDVLTSMTVALGTSNSKFSAALNSKGDISVSGTVKGGAPFLTSIGNFDVDLVIEGTVLLVLQKDRPGLIAAVGQELAEANVNISFMTVSRTQPGKDAVMAIGVDGQPPQSVLDKIPSISGIKEFALFDGPHQ
ncbi:MAG: d-3-phosphoglycerate chloroplastic-like [Trebouxia sp. A1-2]|nr:MAG: d-3-phosphoglycerate chloroplastic-like [Trebouxia sp. A1-2]